MNNIFLPGLNRKKSGTSLKFAKIYLYDNVHDGKSRKISTYYKRNVIKYTNEYKM